MDLIMTTSVQTVKITAGCLLALASLMATSRLRAAEPEEPTQHAESGTVTVTAGGGGAGVAVSGASSGGSGIVIKSIEPTAEGSQPPRKDRPWLGVSVEEGSEALAAQLGLAPGSGLVVTYVSPDSPAAKAGLEKNDVLAELENQLLVHPAQLRKLFLGRKEGDVIELTYYRAGKKQTVSATLGKAPASFGLFDDDASWRTELRRLPGMLPPDTIREYTKPLRDSLENLKVDQSKVKEEVRRSLEQARKAMQDALRYSSNAA
jgi:hypothetical protein